MLALALPIIYATGLVPGPLAGLVLVAGSVLLFLLLAFSDRASWITPAVLVVATLALYLRTLLPSLGEADTFEFQVIVPKLGVAHPTGYPLYVLLTKVFTLLPLRSTAWRVNLASAVYATGAVLLLYFVIFRVAGHKLPSLLAALAFAFSSVFWSQAVVAEVYTLHALLVAVIVWLLVAVAPAKEDRQADGLWLPLALAFGLGLTNHLTTVLLAPAALVALLWDRPRQKLRQWMLAGGLLLAGLSVYAFIPLRWPALNSGSRMTLVQFVEHVSGGQFQGALQLDGWREAVRWSIVGRLIREPLGWGMLALAAVGLVILALRQRRTLAVLGAAFVAFLGYGLSYHVPDIAVFLIPAHLILAIWAGIGISGLVELGARYAGGCGGHALIAAAALLPLSLVWQNLPQVDLSGAPRTEELGRRTLSQELADNSAILADPTRFAPLYYVQQIERLRPDIDIVLLGTEDLYREDLAARLGRGQTVYLARFLPRLEQYWLRSVDSLVEVSNRPYEETYSPGAPLRIKYQSAFALIGIDRYLSDGLDRGAVRLALYWAVSGRADQDYLVRFRLVDGSGEVVWTRESVRPVAGMYPTAAWRAGETVVDYHEFTLPPNLSTGTYSLEVGLFPQFSDDGLLVESGDGPWAAVMEVPVQKAMPAGRPASYMRVLFPPSRWLTGHDAPREAIEGAPVGLTLSWRGEEPDPTGGHGTIMLVWQHGGGCLRRQGLTLPPDSSPGASSVTTVHSIEAPIGEGEYLLMVGWVDGRGHLATVHCGWLAPPTAFCSLQEITVLPARVGVAKFEDQILLLEAKAGVDFAEPGDLVPVDLRWRALRTIDEDYTLFVQLLGPDGRLHGQVDTWPVQGTLPTSQWQPGVDVLDHVIVRLDQDAPDGLCTLQVGWYLVETMHRLQLIGEQGQPYGDSYVVAEIYAAAPGE